MKVQGCGCKPPLPLGGPAHHCSSPAARTACGRPAGRASWRRRRPWQTPRPRCSGAWRGSGTTSCCWMRWRRGCLATAAAAAGGGGLPRHVRVAAAPPHAALFQGGPFAEARVAALKAADPCAWRHGPFAAAPRCRCCYVRRPVPAAAALPAAAAPVLTSCLLAPWLPLPAARRCTCSWAWCSLCGSCTSAPPSWSGAAALQHAAAAPARTRGTAGCMMQANDLDLHYPRHMPQVQQGPQQGQEGRQGGRGRRRRRQRQPRRGRAGQEEGQVRRAPRPAVPTEPIL